MISILATFFLSNISSFLYASPGEIPIYLYVLPQTSLVRVFYLLLAKCVESSCISSLGDVKGELLQCIIILYVLSFIYLIGGLLATEPKFQAAFQNLIGKNKNKNIYDQLPQVDEETEMEQSAVKYASRVEETSATDRDFVLVAKKITKIYKTKNGKKIALRDFSLRLKRGQIFGLLGPNGAGKTTFLSIVTGMARLDQGTAFLGGVDVSKKQNNIPIGFCPQFDILWPQLTVDEHLIFFSLFKDISYSESKKKAKNLIEKVGLQDDYEKRANQLSGGMKRRCSLAMALIGDPQIVFLDEPTSGLDPVKRRQFWTLIKDITEDRAVLLTTHLMEEADTLCKEIGIITAGQLRCIGNSINLKQAFADGMRVQIQVDNPSEKDMEHAGEGEGRRKTEDLTLEQRKRRIQRVNTSKCKRIFEILKTKIPNLKIDSIEGKTLSTIVKEKNVSLANIFRIIKSLENEEGEIADWSISLGTLEDVFLKVVKTYRGQNQFDDL